MYIENRLFEKSGCNKNNSLAQLSKNTLNIAFPFFHCNPKRSILIFSEDNFLRKAIKAIINFSIFEFLIQLTILANCAVLALEQHQPLGDSTTLDKTLDKAEIFFLVIFTLEAAMKIIALGFVVGKRTYLKNPWNVLDFIVISVGVVGSTFHNFDQRVVGALRALRPLKLIYNFESLQIVMQSLLRAMQPLLQIGILILFVIIMYAIIGLEFYSGKFHFSCFKEDLVVIAPDESPLNKFPCSPDLNVTGSYTCPSGYICRTYWEGPNYGVTNFDNIFYASLTVFQCLTMEGWTDVLYFTNRATGTPWNNLYYVSLVIIGSFFMLNLVLGVLSGEFAKERERVEKRTKFYENRQEETLHLQTIGYLDWIEHYENLLLLNEATPENVTMKIYRARKRSEKLRRAGALKTGIGLKYDLESEILSKQIRSNQRLHQRIHKKIQMRCCCSLIKLKLTVAYLLKSRAFFWIIIILVTLNTLIISTEHYGQPEFLNSFQMYAEYVFLSLFMFEMFLKIFAKGFKNYFESQFNILDFTIIVASVLEVVWQYFKTDSSFGISALRTVRILRIFRVTSYWNSMKSLTESLQKSIQSIISLLFLLFLFLFIFAILGMQLFGGSYNFDDGKPDQNFDTFITAIITVFQILTGENWNESMYSGIRSQKTEYSQFHMAYAVYFILIVIIGNYTMLNIFLAIAVDNLANAGSTEVNDSEEDYDEQVKELNEQEKEILYEEDLRHVLGYRSVEVPPLQIIPLDNDASFDSGNGQRFKTILEEIETTCESVRTGYNQDESEKLGTLINPYSSLFIFEPISPFRRLAHFIVNLEHFETFIILAILASSMALATENVVQEDAPINNIYRYFDYVFTAVFAGECLLKIMDNGLILHPGSYLRSIWNIIDVFVVMSSLLYLTLNTTGSTIKSLRVIRVLRPLKTVQRIKKLKEVFETVIQSIKNVINILIVFILLQFVFSVIAVQLFRGKFFYCTDISKKTYELCQGFFIDNNDLANPKVVQRAWQRYCFHYDNVIYAFVTLFTVTTSEGWLSVLRHSMDATNLNEGPIFNYRPEMAVFYVVFFVVFPFFFVNIFVALIIITFQEEGQKSFYDQGIDKNQKLCIDFAVTAQPRSRYVPSNKTSLQYRIWRLVVSTQFEMFILIMIVMNTIVLMLRYYQKDIDPSRNITTEKITMALAYNHYHEALQYLNYAFITLFSLECILKMIGLNPRNYFRDFWNVFDFITVVGSISDVLITSIKIEDLIRQVPNIGFLRLFRAARLVKLLRQIYGIRIILWTFIQAFKSLPYVVLLIFMIFFIYSVFGMQLFGTIQQADGEINIYNNFEDFGSAMLLLFRCATGENWQAIMLACEYGQPCYCVNNTSTNTTCDNVSNTCGSNTAYPYFITFSFLTTFLMLNLFIAVLMENFDYLTRDISILGPHHLDEFIEKWSHYDPEATGQIHYTEMYDLLMKMEPPLGFGRKCPYRMAYKKLIRMNVPVKDYKVHFTTTLMALIRESLSIKKGNPAEADILDMEMRWCISRLWPKVARKKMALLVPGDQELRYPQLTVGKIYTCLWIYENWRAYKAATGGRRGRVHRLFSRSKPVQSRLSERTNSSDNQSQIVKHTIIRPIVHRPVPGKVHDLDGDQLRELMYQKLVHYMRQRFNQNPPTANRCQVPSFDRDSTFNESVRSNSSEHMVTIVTELCKKYKIDLNEIIY